MLRVLISLFLLLALTLSSYGHSILSPEDTAQAESYILAGGSWADLCGEDGMFTGHEGCDACLIAKTISSPAQPTVHQSAPHCFTVATVYAAPLPATHDARHHAAARAPPFA